MEDDRDDPMSDAIDPHLDCIEIAAELAGWHPAEIHCAVLSWTLRGMIIQAHLTDTPAAWAAVMHLPRQVQEMLELERARLAGQLPTLPGTES